MLKEFLTQIADTLRVYLNITNKINAQEFPQMIAMLFDTGWAEGWNNGYEDGYLNGYDQGEAWGWDEGYESGVIECEQTHEAMKAESFKEGEKAEYDRFWDSFQMNGTRTVYSYAFAGSSWTLETFKPKYNINIITGHYMFRDFGKNQEGGIDMVETCQKLDIKLDTSKCTAASYLFSNSAINRLGHMDFTQHGALEYTFNNCTLLETIEKLTFKENGSQIWYTAFGGCTKLKNINAIDGVIGRDADLSSCPLSKQSIVNVVNALSTTQTTRTLTLKKSAVNEAFGIDVDDEATYPQDSEFYILRHSKDNWTFSYV